MVAPSTNSRSHGGGVDPAALGLPPLPPLVLASGSPRRRQLLAQCGLAFRTAIRHVDESPPAGPPAEVAAALAERKAAACADLAADHLVIAADTVVACDGELLAKPGDRAEAAAMLERLGGREHEVVTGICLAWGERRHAFAESTRVRFAPLAGATIAHYAATDAPLDKAGGYGIQDWIGLVAVDRIVGDYRNVVGLPVARLLAELRWWVPAVEG